jgi:hypothetical protein
MRFAAVLIVFLLCVPRACGSAPAWFPGGRTFPEPLADPHESRFGFDWIESGLVSGRAGRGVALARAGDLDLRIDGMLWGWFRQTPGFNFPLETIDGQFGLALEGRAGAWTGRLRYGHSSSHEADGSPGWGGKQVVWSREMITALAAFDGVPRLTLYGGPTFMLRGEPDEPAFAAQLGGVARLEPRGTSPYAAFDLRLKAENADRVNQSYEMGFALAPAARIAAGYETGMSERGQRHDHVEHFFRLGVVLGD